MMMKLRGDFKLTGLIILFFALLVAFPTNSHAVPLTIISTPQATSGNGIWHNAFHDATRSGGTNGNILSWLNLDSNSVNTYDPDTGALNAVLNIFSDSTFGTQIGAVSLTGSLPGDNFNQNTGNTAGNILFNFNLTSVSPLFNRLNNAGACSNIFGQCTLTLSYLDKYFGTSPQGRLFNSWQNGELVLWGKDGQNILGSDLVFKTQGVIPEPATVALLATGLIGGVGLRKRR